MSTKHTPGPYAVDLHLPTNNPCVVTQSEYGEGRIVAVCTNSVYSNADAHLLAAAPDLLQAAELALTELDPEGKAARALVRAIEIATHTKQRNEP